MKDYAMGILKRVGTPLLHWYMWAYYIVVQSIFTLWNLRKARTIVPKVTDDLLTISASQAAEMIRNQEITATQLIKSYIARIERVNPLLNALIQPNFVGALREAKEADELIDNLDSDELKKLAETKPLLGVPFTVKDTIRVRGLRSTCGLPVFADAPESERDAEAVKRLRDAGAIPLGITNVPEAGLWWETENNNYGRTCNPYDLRRIVGGSSGGEGALLGAAGSVMGLGSDIGGSIRMPAFFNGVFGLKPTPHLVPVTGHIPDVYPDYQQEMIALGPICRYARDLPVMFKVLVGPENSAALKLDEPVNLRRLRIFYMKGFHPGGMYQQLHPDCLEALQKAAKYFEKKYDTSIYNLDFPIAHHAFDIFLASMRGPGTLPVVNALAGFTPNRKIDLGVELGRWLVGRSEHTSAALLGAVMDGAPDIIHPNRDFVISKREQLKREVTELLGDDGILLFPGFCRPAYFHGQTLWTPFDFSYTALWSTLSVPVIQCPMGINANGLPLGVQVIAGPRMERLLIAVAQDLEEGFRGWSAPGRELF